MIMNQRKNIAFDIECSRCYLQDSEICAFGYSVADDSFEIIEKEDILIKPKRPIQERLIEIIPFNQNELDNSPPFFDVYEQICSILKEDGVRLFAHDAKNDLKYLIYECKINKLDMPDITVYDTKRIFKLYAKPERAALYNAANWIETDYQQHIPSEDSSICIGILRKILNELGDSFEEWLLSVHEKITVDTKTVQKDIIRSVLVDKYNKLKNIKPDDSKSSSHLFGVCVSICHEIEKNDLELAIEIAKKVTTNGGYISKKVTESTIFIESGCEDSGRKKCALIMLGDGEEIDIMTPSQFFDFINNLN